MSIEAKKVLVGYLIKLVELPNDTIVWRGPAGIAVFRKYEQGICCSITDMHQMEHGDDYVMETLITDIMKVLFKKWPHFSGDPIYPIPGGLKMYTEVCGYAKTFWEGEQGEYRINLCNFMIQELNKELANVQE